MKEGNEEQGAPSPGTWPNSPPSTTWPAPAPLADHGFHPSRPSPLPCRSLPAPLGQAPAPEARASASRPAERRGPHPSGVRFAHPARRRWTSRPRPPRAEPAFSKAIPNVKGIVVATRSGTRLSEYTDSSTQGPGVKALSASITALSAVLARANGPARDQALVDGLVKALDGYDVELPGLWESPVFLVIFIALLLAIFLWIGMKFAPSGGGGGGDGSSSWSSSSSDTSSSGGYSGGGYSGGGGSSGGGGASDDY